MNGTEMINTPGYYYAVSYCVSAMAISYAYKRTLRGWKSALLNAGFLTGVVMLMIWTTGIERIRFVLLMLFIVLLLYAYIYFCCDFNGREAGFYCVKVFITGECAASFCWQIYYRMMNGHPQPDAYVYQALEMLVFYGIVYTGVYFLEKKLQKDLEELYISWRELNTVVFIGVMIYFVSNLSYVSPETIFSARYARDIFTVRTLVDITGIVLLYAYHIQLKEMKLRFEKDTLQNIMQMQYQNYQLSQESVDMVNQKYHDLKHQIALLRAESTSGKSVQYLDKMEREIRIYETQYKTGNKVLDTVLMGKSAYCQNKDIELKAIVQGELLSFMEDMDISAVFGNMLDNAIEHVEKIPEQEKRLIRLSVTTQKSFLLIRMENYCAENVQFRNGLPLTTKTDKRLHGYGMKSIRTTVGKYGGTVTACLKDHWFVLKILIPMQDDKER